MPKKTVQVIVSSGNHYIIQVKRNQKILLKQVQNNTDKDKECIASYVEESKGHGRKETRKIFIYKDISGVSEEWTGVSRLIRVERYVLSKQGQRHETSYYISDIKKDKASFFAEHIRSHWGVENRLHWVKDAIMKEDDSKVRKGMAPENFSILRNIVCNIYRSNGFDSIKYAIELYANNIKELFNLINRKLKPYKIT